jgi:hypothetical protein
MAATNEQPALLDAHGNPLDGMGDDPKGSTTLYIGIGGSLHLIAIIIAVAAIFYYQMQRENQRKLYDQSWPEVAKLKAAQNAEISSYRWIDRDKGVVGIPIEQAMELVVSEAKSGKR